MEVPSRGLPAFLYGVTWPLQEVAGEGRAPVGLFRVVTRYEGVSPSGQLLAWGLFGL